MPSACARVRRRTVGASAAFFIMDGFRNSYLLVNFRLLHWRRIVLQLGRRWITSWVDQPRALEAFLRRARILPHDWNMVQGFVKLARNHFLFVNHVDIHDKDFFLTRFTPRKRPDLALPYSVITQYVLPCLRKVDHRVSCWKCGEDFKSRNELFQHLRAGCYLEPCLPCCSSCAWFKHTLELGSCYHDGRPVGFALR